MSASLTRKVHQAAAALAEGDPARAEHLCREVLKRAPRHPQALQVSAAACLRQGDGAGAGELLRRALADDPRSPQLLEGPGAAALKAANFAEAESWLRRALDLAPGNADVRYRLGVVLNLGGEHDRAAQHLEALLADRPDHVDALNELGIALQQLGQLEDAELCFRRALEREGANPGWYSNLGNALFVQGRYGEAEAAFEKAVAIEPDSVLPLGMLGLIRVEQGQSEAGRDLIGRAMRSASGIARGWCVDHFNDLESMFAIIAACDLVITTSNVTAHFAGTMGKAAWLLFPGGHAPFHYWVPGPDGRSLWYPSLEIVSAPQLADWGSLAEYAAERLRKEWPVNLGRA